MQAGLLRQSTRGKFLFRGDEKVYVRGVTYGTFRPGEDGHDLPSRRRVEGDFARMRANGVNVVRVYAVPPPWFLDLAHERDLAVMVGIPWEQHVAFLGDRGRADAIEERVRAGVRACAGHPGVLCYAVGNEIPAGIVRWHGRRRIEHFLARLHRAAKAEDPQALVTYVNYPSTEYLQLPFLDLVCFNVFLEAEELLEAYLARLQNIAGDRPLLLTEVGLDSRRNGKDVQAVGLDWQIRTAFRSGCAGVFAFSWTDEWHRGGYEVEDWDFGLTDRKRRPKPALAAVRRAFAEVPFPEDVAWPPVSVIVCTHDGARTLGDCLQGLAALDYPDYEVIVVDDGSTDETAAVAEQFDVRLVRTENRGLASARNTGLAAARAELVAYLDDDAKPDAHWLKYLAATFMATAHAGVGGPNVPPPDSGPIAAGVAMAPGGPVHVLLSDREAEHIPGCNMAFRKAALERVGGFDPQFHVAGDDVDICWRLQNLGWTLGFSAAAMVFHRRRDSVRAFFRQQRGYGRAEALLERKWPEKYNRGGHPTWSGRIYGGGVRSAVGRRWRVYYGTWGTGLFQSIYDRGPGTLASLPLMPEWYLLILALAGASAYGLLVDPLFFAVPLLGIPLAVLGLAGAVAALLLRAAAGARASLAEAPALPGTPLRLWAVTTFLHLIQPAARLAGRVRLGLTPWRWRSPVNLALPRPRNGRVWCERWIAPADRLLRIEAELQPKSAGVVRGQPYDRWDLHARGGAFGAARLRFAVEEHGEGKQLLRFRVWPRPSRGGVLLAAALAGFAVAAVQRDEVATAVILGALAALLVLRLIRDCAAAVAASLATLAVQADPEDEDLVFVLEQEAEDARRRAPAAVVSADGERIRPLGAEGRRLE